MEKCSFCGAELPVEARFCAYCGRMQNTTSTIDEREQEQQAQFGRWTSQEEQDEQRRRDMPSDFVLPIGPMGSGQPSAGHVPLVQGTPQMSGVPVIQQAASPAASLSPMQGFVQGTAPSAPSSFLSSQAPSPSLPYA